VATAIWHGWPDGARLFHHNRVQSRTVPNRAEAELLSASSAGKPIFFKGLDVDGGTPPPSPPPPQIHAARPRVCRMIKVYDVVQGVSLELDP
jgi:hypothetical protein